VKNKKRQVTLGEAVTECDQAGAIHVIRKVTKVTNVLRNWSSLADHQLERVFRG